MIAELLSRYSRHVEFLGEELCDVRQVGAAGSQVLHLASFANRCDDIEEILSAGADINAIGDLGLCPLHYAVLGGSIDAVRLLVTKGANAKLENEFGERPVHMAHLLGQTEIEDSLQDLSGNVAYGFDGGTAARSRWLEFKSIQEGNFWTD